MNATRWLYFIAGALAVVLIVISASLFRAGPGDRPGDLRWQIEALNNRGN